MFFKQFVLPSLGRASYLVGSEESGEALVLDVRQVRQPAEWSAGHIPSARHITGAQLVERAGELPKDRPIAAICGSGYRSSVAAGLL